MGLNEINRTGNSNYYKAETLWKNFGAQTREEYVSKFVIQGHFIPSVPEDVLNAYETAEYLMAHAWYYWPMYDEALKKLTGILEIAVKQKGHRYLYMANASVRQNAGWQIERLKYKHLWQKYFS